VTDQMPPGWENQVPPGPYGQPGYPPFGQQGQPGLPPYPHHGYGKPGPGGWPVAPAPGGIPLRPLALGDILNGAVTLVRRNPAATFGLAAIVMTIYGVATALVQQVGRSTVASDEQTLKNDSTLTSQQVGHLIGSLFGALVPALVVAIVLALLLNTALSGMLSAVIGRGVLGQRTSLAEAWRDGRIGPVIATVLLLLALGICVPLPVVVLVVLLALLHLTPVAVLLGVLGGIASLVFEVLLAIRLSLALPAVVLERISPVSGIRRSWQLTHGSFWRLLGILLLTAIIVGVAAEVLTIPFLVIGALLGGSGSIFSATASVSVAAIVVGTVGSIVSATITRPVSAGVVVLLYVDMRMRREGLDLRLRDAAQHQALTGEEFAAVWQPAAGQQGPAQPA